MPSKKDTTAKWLKLSREICAELRPKILAVSGTPKAAETVNAHGASGDETTYIDALSEKIFAKHLRAFQRSGEKFSLLSEEVGLVSYGAPYPILVVDPIDGSINCKRGLPFHSVSIGVFTGPTIGDGIFGYVVNLANGDEFHAASGSGKSYMNGKLINFKLDTKRAPKLLLVEFPLTKDVLTKSLPLMMAADRTRVMGSMALAIAYTASGACDMFLHLKPSRVIDYAGAKIVFEEAGGLVSDENGATLDSQTIDLARKTMLVAARGKALQKTAIQALKK
jgi:myo-inositol-1(or 4)-monophosphatase